MKNSFFSKFTPKDPAMNSSRLRCIVGFILMPFPIAVSIRVMWTTSLWQAAI